jgi:bifunctional N-acetylglucosamine-1-phosphate-uridyltransferase/glucosamine-1-phosphate-acetyltransferase GlmU-like protein
VKINFSLLTNIVKKIHFGIWAELLKKNNKNSCYCLSKKDSTEEQQKKINENKILGNYGSLLVKFLHKIFIPLIDNNNSQQEYYFKLIL